VDGGTAKGDEAASLSISMFPCSAVRYVWQRHSRTMSYSCDRGGALGCILAVLWRQPNDRNPTLPVPHAALRESMRTGKETRPIPSFGYHCPAAAEAKPSRSRWAHSQASHDDPAVFPTTPQRTVEHFPIRVAQPGN
jgi:hypothetical protein